MRFLQRALDWAKRLKREGLTLWFAAKDPRTPWVARFLGAAVVAYAFSPIDLIPDFIPVLGYLDDLVLLPAMIWLAIRMLPPVVLKECRTLADAAIASSALRPRSRAGAVAVVVIWLVVTAAVAAFCFTPRGI
jgi:uncharacterized membrane protein YkvA (DUF1232 family)